MYILVFIYALLMFRFMPVVREILVDFARRLHIATVATPIYGIAAKKLAFLMQCEERL